MEDLAVFHAQQAEHILAKLRAELLTGEEKEDIGYRVQQRKTILKLMGGSCPIIEQEIGELTRQAAAPLLNHAAWRLTDLPVVFLNLLITKTNLSMMDLEVVAIQDPKNKTKRFRALVNAHYKSIISNAAISPERKAALLEFIENCRPPLFKKTQYDNYETPVGIFIPLLYAVMNGNQKFAHDFFIEKKNKLHKNYPVIRAHRELRYSTPRQSSAPHKDNYNYTPSDLIELGIATYQPAEVFLVTSAFYSPGNKRILRVDSISRIVEYIINACEKGNYKILDPLMFFCLKDYDDKRELMHSGHIDTIHTELQKASQTQVEMFFLTAYRLHRVTMAKVLIEKLGLSPLFLINKAMQIDNTSSRKVLILDMLESYITQHPQNTIAQDLKKALDSSTPFEMPQHTRSLEFFKKETDLVKLYKLARPFIKAPEKALVSRKIAYG